MKMRNTNDKVCEIMNKIMMTAEIFEQREKVRAKADMKAFIMKLFGGGKKLHPFSFSLVMGFASILAHAHKNFYLSKESFLSDFLTILETFIQ